MNALSLLSMCLIAEGGRLPRSGYGGVEEEVLTKMQVPRPGPWFS